MRVLLVEDDRSTRRFVKIILEKLGYQITECESAEEAWESYQQDFHSLAVLDWMLPGMSGVELCRQIRAMPQSEGTVIIMSTSQAELSDVEIALKAGADDYIVKPVDITQMKIRLFIAEQRIKARKDQLQIIEALKSKLKNAEARPHPTPEVDSGGQAIIINPWQGILVVPLFGTTNSLQISQIRERLFGTIEKSHTRQVILDLSGISSIAADAAQVLINTLRAIKLVGAQAIMVGVKGKVATALIESGFDPNNVDTFTTLQEGLLRALNKMAYKVIKNR